MRVTDEGGGARHPMFAARQQRQLHNSPGGADDLGDVPHERQVNMARKQAPTKKRGKAAPKARRRIARHRNAKPSLELTNYLLESHPEFGN